MERDGMYDEVDWWLQAQASQLCSGLLWFAGRCQYWCGEELLWGDVSWTQPSAIKYSRRRAWNRKSHFSEFWRSQVPSQDAGTSGFPGGFLQACQWCPLLWLMGPCMCTWRAMAFSDFTSKNTTNLIESGLCPLTLPSYLHLWLQPHWGSRLWHVKF